MARKQKQTAEKAHIIAPSAENVTESISPSAELERIAALEKELAELKDRALRSLAEAENTRKRAERDVEEAHKYGASSFARDVATALDNLFRAEESVSEADAAGHTLLKNLRDGVVLSKNEFVNVLQRYGVKRVSPLGEKFDHNLHQAVTEIATSDHPPGHIAQVIQAGYTIHGRLLRPALVVVAKAS